MDQLKLIALDAQDLEVVSAHLQDAVLKVRDMIYMPQEKRFAAIMNRFDWSRLLNGGTDDGSALQRRQCALRFERVLRAQVSGIDLAAKDTVLSLLAARFEPNGADDPSGSVTLIFSGNAAVRLEVECVEAELKDLGPVWRTHARPRHPDADRDDDTGEAAPDPAGQAGGRGRTD